VLAPLASVRVKKLLVAKFKEAVVEAIEEDITFPLNDPVIIALPLTSIKFVFTTGVAKVLVLGS